MSLVLPVQIIQQLPRLSVPQPTFTFFNPYFCSFSTFAKKSFPTIPNVLRGMIPIDDKCRTTKMLTTFITNPRRPVTEKDYFLGLTQATTTSLQPNIPAKSLRIVESPNVTLLLSKLPILPVNTANLYFVPAICFMGFSAIYGHIKPLRLGLGPRDSSVLRKPLKLLALIP